MDKQPEKLFSLEKEGEYYVEQVITRSFLTEANLLMYANTLPMQIEEVEQEIRKREEALKKKQLEKELEELKADKERLEAHLEQAKSLAEEPQEALLKKMKARIKELKKDKDYKGISLKYRDKEVRENTKALVRNHIVNDMLRDFQGYNQQHPIVRQLFKDFEDI